MDQDEQALFGLNELNVAGSEIPQSRNSIICPGNRTVVELLRRRLVLIEAQVPAQLLEGPGLIPELDPMDMLHLAIGAVASDDPDRGDRCRGVVVPFVGMLETPILMEEAAQI